MASLLMLLLVANVVMLISPRLTYVGCQAVGAKVTTLVPNKTVRYSSSWNQPETVRVKIYSLYGGDNNKLSWSAAFLYCRSMDSYLATIENEEDYNNLQNKLQKIPKETRKKSRFWLGGVRDISYEWLWADSAKTLSFAPWAPGQPNIQGLCLELSSGDEDNKKNGRNLKNSFQGRPQLYSRPCEKDNNFICHTVTNKPTIVA